MSNEADTETPRVRTTREGEFIRAGEYELPPSEPTAAETVAIQKKELGVLRHSLSVAAQRIEQLEFQVASKSVSERKNTERIDALEQRVSDHLFSMAPLLEEVRQELFERRSRIEDAVNRISNSLQGDADRPTRAEFDVLVASFRTLKAGQSRETENGI